MLKNSQNPAWVDDEDEHENEDEQPDSDFSDTLSGLFVRFGTL